ncbi:MAG: hypothetical protein NHF97_00295, partial [Flavobacteriia bacterium]|nr:hypothetical protein [Candidatus Bostrichicola ureolyticus]
MLKYYLFFLLLFFFKVYGDNKYYELLDNKINTDISISSMGGLSTVYDSKFELNFKNPANNSQVKNLIFNMNFNIEFSDLSNIDYFYLKNNNNLLFSNISLGFPISENIVGGFGLKPYAINQGNHLNVLNTFICYKINNKISGGVLMDYLFGLLDDDKHYLFNGLNSKLGILYKIPLKNKYYSNIGINSNILNYINTSTYKSYKSSKQS